MAQVESAAVIDKLLERIKQLILENSVLQIALDATGTDEEPKED